MCSLMSECLQPLLRTTVVLVNVYLSAVWILGVVCRVDVAAEYSSVTSMWIARGNDLVIEIDVACPPLAERGSNRLAVGLAGHILEPINFGYDRAKIRTVGCVKRASVGGNASSVVIKPVGVVDLVSCIAVVEIGIPPIVAVIPAVIIFVITPSVPFAIVAAVLRAPVGSRSRRTLHPTRRSRRIAGLAPDKHEHHHRRDAQAYGAAALPQCHGSSLSV